MSSESHKLFATSQIAEPNRLIRKTQSYALSIRTQRKRSNLAFMLVKRAHFRTAGNIPDLDNPVRATGDKLFPIGCECKPTYQALVSVQHHTGGVNVRIPYLDR